MSGVSDQGIRDFMERRANFFHKVNLDGSFKERIEELKERMTASASHKPLVVIAGAGPAGLLRAIQALSNGNPVKVIEKRSADAAGRTNTVALTKTTIAMLKYVGVYPYLIENQLIYPPNKLGYISVRLKDLEAATKAVLQALSPDSIIEYETKLVEINTNEAKIQLVTESSNGTKSTISDVDILVNTEGARSSTNNLLGIERTEVLPSIPVVAAMCKDIRPKIIDVSSFFSYVGRSIADIAITIYYNTIFFFQFLFSKDFRKQITGSIILPTPGQNYVGCGFSDGINEQLQALKESGDNQAYQAFAEYWINMAICSANLVANFSWLAGRSYRHTACYRPLDSFEIVHIGADYANKSALKLKDSAVLLAGDASATVDPTTGLGCNTAIQSSTDFLEFIWDYETLSTERLLQNYQTRTDSKIEYIHRESKLMRSLYRPDALMPVTMFSGNRADPSTREKEEVVHSTYLGFSQP